MSSGFGVGGGGAVVGGVGDAPGVGAGVGGVGELVVGAGGESFAFVQPPLLSMPNASAASSPSTASAPTTNRPVVERCFTREL